MLYGVDVHTEYQAGLDIERLADEGHTFLVVKATQGAGTYVAPSGFDSWIRRGAAAGLIVGAYHWLDASDPVRQADTFYARLAPVGGPDGLLLQIDCEDTVNPASAARLAAFVAQLRRRAGARPLLFYTGAWWYGAHLGSYNAAALGLSSWHSHYVGGTGSAAALARYVSDPMWTPGYGGFNRAAILQFSSRGSAGGIIGNVDVNLFDGTREQLLALTTANGDDMSWDQVSAVLGGTVEAGFADNANVSSVPAWVKPNVGYNLKNVAARLDAMNAALNAAVTDAKARDAANAVTVAALQAAVTKLSDALSKISVAGGGIQVDPAAVTDAVTQVVRAEAAAVRELVERRHADELIELQHDRDAEVAGLLAEVDALKQATGRP